MNTSKRQQQPYRLVERKLTFTQGTDAAVLRYMRESGKADAREAYRQVVVAGLKALGYPIQPQAAAAAPPGSRM